MRRRFARSAGVAAAAFLALQTSAAAKPGHGPHTFELRSVVLHGPGIDGSKRLDGDSQAAKLLFRHSGMSWALMRGTPLSISAAPTAADRGPRYSVDFRLTASAERAFGLDRGRLRLHLYPHARGRPWAFTPEGQGLSAHGWWPVSVQLVSSYDALGLSPPKPADADVQASGSSTDPSDPGSARARWVVLTGLVLSGMAWAGLRRLQKGAVAQGLTVDRLH